MEWSPKLAWAAFGVCIAPAIIVVCILFSPPPPGVAVAILGGLAVWLTLMPPKDPSKSEKALWLSVAFFLMVIEIMAITHDRKQQDNNFSAVVGGLQTTINQGKASITEGNMAIAALQTTIEEGRQHFDQTIDTQTGGESFSYLTWVPGQSFLAFIHQGDFPLYGVTARIVDLDQIHTNPTGTIVVVGDMIKGHANVENVPPGMTSSAEHFDANIFFSARNGSWTEQFRTQRTKDGWARALRVSGEFITLKKSKPLCETIDKQFTLDLGKDWIPNPTLPHCK